MEFLPLSRRRSSSRNVPGGEERGETDVFAGYYTPQIESFLVIINFTSQNTTSTNVACEMTGDVFLILFTDLPNQIKMQNFMQYKPIIGSKKGLRNLFQI